MTATNHALTGAVIALAVKQPALAIPLAFLSHFAMDSIPHFDARTGSEREAKIFISTDLLIGGGLIIVLSLLLRSHLSPLLLFSCMALAISPDLVWVWRYLRIRDINKVFTESMSKLSRLHMKIQWSDTRPGIFVELTWLIAMVYLINLLTR